MKIKIIQDKNIAACPPQELFDWVYYFLMTQKKKSVMANGKCAYRGLDDLKCAVGCCISDKAYRPKIECNEIKTAFDMIKLDAKNNFNLLRSLQKLHDNSTPAQWPQEFKQIATTHGLSTDIADICLESIEVVAS